MNKKTNKLKTRFVNDNEMGARKQLLEELFYDFNRSRFQVYWINFVRGLFFGLGTLVGGTVVVAAVIWILGQFVTVPYIGDYIHQVIVAIDNA